MQEKAIIVNGVTKGFSVPHERTSTIKSKFIAALSGKKRRTNTKQIALDGISFEVKKGEFFGIVGRNGSGKSTLLKMLASIYQPTKGSILVAGKLVPFIELGVGFNPELTGRENVYLNGALLGFSQKEVNSMYKEIVSFAELDDFMDQKLKNYSSGMQVRLAFSMAIRAKADVLLIDEVLAVGDADFQRKCYDYFQQVKSGSTTVVFVTHDMGAVRQYCDRALLIDDAKIVSVGDPEKIAKQYTKLFAQENSGQEAALVNGNRWGDGKLRYMKAKAGLNEKNEVVIDLIVQAKEDVQDPTYGFMIANEANQPLLGSNTMIEQVRLKSIKAGDTQMISWVVPHVFNEGTFIVEVTIMYNTVTIVADWWESACRFRIKKDKRTPYLVNPTVKFAVKNEARTK